MTPEDACACLVVGLIAMSSDEINVRTEVGRVAGVGCCFCDERITRTRLDPVTIDLVARDEDVTQVLWAHARCLRAARIADLRPEFYEQD
jgi:hypothetical protein